MNLILQYRYVHECKLDILNYIHIHNHEIILPIGSEEYAISQLRIVRSGLHLVTYLDVGNFCDKNKDTTLHEVCVPVFLRFSHSSKPSQSVSLIRIGLACLNR